MCINYISCLIEHIWSTFQNQADSKCNSKRYVENSQFTTVMWSTFFRASLMQLLSNSVIFILARWHKRREDSSRNILGATLLRTNLPQKEIFRSVLGTCRRVVEFRPNSATTVSFDTIYSLILPTVVKSLEFEARSQNCEETFGFVMSVRSSVRMSAWNSAHTKQIFMKFDIWVFFEYLWRKFSFIKSGNNKAYFTWRKIHIFFSYLA
jgi:hypothetical protein